MKVIFYDVDGVGNCVASTSRCERCTGIDDDKLERLKQIVDATGAYVVLSSTWRLGYNKDGHKYAAFGKYLKKKFKEHQLEVYDVTPDFGKHGWLRGEEILDWLVKHPDVDRYLILDDEEYDFYMIGHEITDHWIQTEYYSDFGGLQDEHVKKAIETLNGDSK